MAGQETYKYFYNGHLTDEAIALMADAVIFGKERMLPSQLRAHVEECSQCKKEISGVYEVIKQDNELKNYTYHPFFGNIGNRENKFFLSHKRYFIQLAAVFLLLLGISVVLFYLVPRGKVSNFPKQQAFLPGTTKPQKGADTANNLVNNKAIKKDAFAVNMEKSVFFESLIASQYRSGDIEILAPGISQQYAPDAPVRFELKGEISGPLTLMIYNNKGKELFEKAPIFSKSFTPETKFSSGLYYWKLLKGDDLVHVGKFIVK